MVAFDAGRALHFVDMATPPRSIFPQIARFKPLVSRRGADVTMTSALSSESHQESAALIVKLIDIDWPMLTYANQYLDAR